MTVLRRTISFTLLLVLAITPTLSADDQTQLGILQQRLSNLEARFKASPGYALNTQIQLPGNLHVVSVLLPPEEVAKIFGKDVGNSLAVVRVTLSNASREAAFVVKALSIDYGSWPLANCDLPGISEKVPFSFSGAETTSELQLKGTEAFSYPCRVASMEVREVRQIARLGQTNSLRNKTDRALRGAGVAGGALTGVFRHGSLFPRIVAAYTAGAVPVFEDIFKDAAEDQINLLNDLAFRINVLIPKESSITVTGFFPMTRFLSSDLAEIFKKEPALFFSPGQYLITSGGRSKSKIDFDKFFNRLLDRKTSTKPLCKNDGSNKDNCLTADVRLNEKTNLELKTLLAEVSLNHIYVVASGEFVANVDAAAPQISDLAFEKPVTDMATFGQAGTVTGTLLGTGLKDATPKIANAATVGVKIERIEAGSDETHLKFKLTLDHGLSREIPLQFVAVKTAGGREWTSNTREITFLLDQPKPTITSTTLTGKPGDTLTVIGTGFYEIPNSKLEAWFTADDTAGQPSEKADVTRVSSTEIKAVIPAKVKPGARIMQIHAGTQVSGSVVVTVK